MRVYGVLMGVVMTAGSGALAQLAVASSGLDHLARSAQPSGAVWYGGVLAPITIEAARTSGPALASPVTLTARECAQPVRPPRAAAGSDTLCPTVSPMLSM